MMRDDALNSCIDPVRTEMTVMQQILILHVCSTYESESKEFILDKNFSQVYSTDEGESESTVFDKSYTEESKSESVQKIINEEKYTIDEIEHE